MPYKIVSRGKGFISFKLAYESGAIGKPSDQVFIGIFPFTKKYGLIHEWDGKLVGTDDPVMGLPYNFEELIGNKNWKVKRYT